MNHRKKIYVSNCNRSQNRGGVKLAPSPRSIKVEIGAQSIRVKNIFNNIKFIVIFLSEAEDLGYCIFVQVSTIKNSIDQNS